MANVGSEQLTRKEDLIIAQPLKVAPILLISCPCCTFPLRTLVAENDVLEADSLGNIIPSGIAADALLASIEYAVVMEKAGRIVVCGHTRCKMLDLIRAQPDFRIVPTSRVDVPVHSSPDVQEVEGLVESNVLLQLDHLRALDSVREQLAVGSLSLHGRVVYEELRYVAEFDPLSNAFLMKHTYSDASSPHIN